MSILNPGDLSVFVTAVGSEVSPVAGAELTIPAIANYRSELINLSFLFTADANAADRKLYIEHHHDSVVNRIAYLKIKITANEVKHVVCNQSAEDDIGNEVDTFHMCVPHYPFIFEGDTLVVRVTNIQATDAITVVKRAWKLWIYEQ